MGGKIIRLVKRIAICTIIVFSLYWTVTWIVNFMTEDNVPKNELSELTKLIQKRIYNLQHPSNCKTAKKINCIIEGGCGFSCQMHAISYCLIVGYSKKRLVLPVFDHWIYSDKGWNEFFLPLTNCTVKDNMNGNDTKGKDDDTINTLNVPHYNYYIPTLPPAFPKEFSEQFLRLHSNPPLFWIGQFMRYIMRYQPKLQKHISDKTKLVNFHHPLAAIHVRRTDKLVEEAHKFEIDEYMKHISIWFDKNVKQHVIRRVYLATDETEVINQTLSKYRNYEFLFDYKAAHQAKLNRYTDSSLMDMITSLHVMINCNFVVCTFSSNICRLVYELMQVVKSGDYSNNVLSLDAIWFYHGQQPRQQIAVIEHKPTAIGKNEIELNVGDLLEVSSVPHQLSTDKVNEFDGLIQGRNLRTNIAGKYPLGKVKEKWRIIDFPNYTVIT